MQDLYQIDTRECAPIVELELAPCQQRGVGLYIKREDQLHPQVSGNKYRKLKYNLQHAVEQGYSTLLSFGGAWSNHIHALAYAGQHYGLNTIGIIRGEAEYAENPTLSAAQACGMQLQFVDRQTYKRRHDPLWLEQLQKENPETLIIPEGGSNQLALHGIAEIWQDLETTYDYVVTAAGSGGTAAGLIASAPPSTHILVVPVLKGGFMRKSIESLLGRSDSHRNYSILEGYHRGGYARVDDSLIQFIHRFEQEHDIPLDPVYTAKMVYAVLAEIEQGRFQQGDKVLMLHTGGLQGRQGLLG